MTLISAQALFDGLPDPSLRIVDARFALADPPQGLKDYLRSHVPGARHVDLDGDLSGPKTDLQQGRHALLSDAQFSALLERLGIAPEHHVVVYDQSDGAMAASRFWFLLALAGHQKVSVLDGGLNQWLAHGFPVTDALPDIPATHYPVHFEQDRLVDVRHLKELLAVPSDTVLLDARGPERFCGEVEPLDSKAGHIPGALNRPYSQNLENGVFKSPQQLRAEFAPFIQGRKNIVLSCGSGVTAAILSLGLTLTGARNHALYDGSWTEWGGTPENKVEVGP